MQQKAFMKQFEKQNSSSCQSLKRLFQLYWFSFDFITVQGKQSFEAKSPGRKGMAEINTNLMSCCGMWLSCWALAYTLAPILILFFHKCLKNT